MTEICIRRLRGQGYYHLGEWLCEKYIELYPLSTPLQEELAIFYFHTGRYNDSFALLNKIMDLRPSDDVLERCLFNKRLLMDKMVESASILEPPTDVVLNPLPLITFSITTCRRLDLFLKTMNSFIRNCTDHHLISRWICVDDNSSESDRQIMKKTYPFMEFIWKDETNKGHAKSMQIITTEVKTPYLFHMEDDWLFFDNRRYISDMLEILGDDPFIGQVLINKNYTEIPTHTIVGGHVEYTKKNLRYYVHEHCVSDKERMLFSLKYGPNPHCNYWPHYSLRPSLINTKIYNTLAYRDVTCFENDFAQRYVMAGFKSAFLQGVYSKHIGRLTSERNNIDKFNAYDLLDVDQFSEEKRVEAYVINLDKRPDRYKRFIQQVAPLIPYQVERISACDGTKLVSSPRLRSLFEKNDYHMRRGIVGCALSHLKLMVNLTQSTTAEYYLIFEDDVMLNADFTTRVKRVLKTLPNDAAMVFLAHTPRRGVPPDNRSGLIKYTRDESFKYTIGGAMCYLVSARGAKTLLDYIDKHGMTNAIDTMMQLITNESATYYLLPTVLSEDPVSEDTNIQNDFSPDLDVEGELSQYKIYGENGNPDFLEGIGYQDKA